MDCTGLVEFVAQVCLHLLREPGDDGGGDDVRDAKCGGGISSNAAFSRVCDDTSLV